MVHLLSGLRCPGLLQTNLQYFPCMIFFCIFHFIFLKASEKWHWLVSSFLIPALHEMIPDLIDGWQNLPRKPRLTSGATDSVKILPKFSATWSSGTFWGRACIFMHKFLVRPTAFYHHCLVRLKYMLPTCLHGTANFWSHRGMFINYFSLLNCERRWGVLRTW